MSQAARYAAAYRDGAFGALAETYLHRARREDGFGILAGREAIVAEAIITAAALRDIDAVVRHDGTSVGAIELSGVYDGGLWGLPRGDEAARVAIREHRWSRYEGGLVAEDIVVTDWAAIVDMIGADVAAAAASVGGAHPTHPPLGELQSGQGQLATASTAGFEGPRQELVDVLHRIWNGRRFDEIGRLYADDATWTGPRRRSGNPAALRAWLTRLVARLPDATFCFDRIEDAGDSVALLWHLFGHSGGRRVRLVGSTLLRVHGGRVVADETLLDELALEATAHRPLLTL